MQTILNSIKSIDYKDLMSRASWTFLQGFGAVVILALEPIVELAFTANWAGLYALSIATVVGAVGAGLSALKTFIISLIREIKK